LEFGCSIRDAFGPHSGNPVSQALSVKVVDYLRIARHPGVEERISQNLASFVKVLFSVDDQNLLQRGTLS
jgi:hypothetical protein